MKRQRIFSKQPGVVKMRAVASDTAEILIYDEIGEGWFGGLGSKEFLQQLTALGDVKTINVRINSPGGDVFEGVAIYNALRMHPATVNVQIDSLCASIATVIAMAGDTITIAPTAMMMVHNPWAIAMGDSGDMRDTAELLDKLRDSSMLTAYQRTELSPEELTAIMAAETWYNAQEAIDAGWADALATPPAEQDEPAATAQYDLSVFHHPPEATTTEPAHATAQASAVPSAAAVDELAAENAAVFAAQRRNESLRLALL